MAGQLDSFKEFTISQTFTYAIDTAGNKVLIPLSKHVKFEELTAGIEWFYFIYAFIGCLLFIIFKIIRTQDKLKTEGKEFFFIRWLQDRGWFLLFSLISSVLSPFAVQYYQSPTILSSIGSGMVAGTVLYNLMPAILNYGTKLANKLFGGISQARLQLKE